MGTDPVVADPPPIDPVPFDLEGRRFRMVSSTASTVDAAAPTVFEYRQSGEVLWGSYSGDTVAEGRFVGSRLADVVRVSFVHALVTGGGVVHGTAESHVEQRPDGLLQLVERFDVGGEPHESVCIEVRSA